MENSKGRILVDNLADTLTEVFGSPIQWQSEPHGHSGSYRPDFVLEISTEGRGYRLVIEAKSSLFPRDAREAIWQLKSYLAHYKDSNRPALPVLMAETISPGARQVLRDEQIGYFDQSGSLFIAGKGLYLRIDKPALRKQSRSLNNLFAGRRAQVLHAAWLAGQHWFGVHEIAKQAGVSPATASDTLIGLERREWVEIRGAGPTKERRLSNRRALLDAWSAYQTSIRTPVARHYYVRAMSVPELQKQLDHACAVEDVPYELTGVSAGQIHAPHLSSVSQVLCRAPLGRPLQTVLDVLDARPVKDGWNLGVYEMKSASGSRFRQRLDGLWVADPLQTYLDLLKEGGRAKDLAQHLRAERLDA